MNDHRPSAKIYRFVPRSQGRRPAPQAASHEAATRAQQAALAVEGAWYHAAAVRESERGQQS